MKIRKQYLSEMIKWIILYIYLILVYYSLYRNGQVLEFAATFKYLGSFVQNDANQDKELNRVKWTHWVSGNDFR